MASFVEMLIMMVNHLLVTSHLYLVELDHDYYHANGANLSGSASNTKQGLGKMKFVFDLDGTLSFDYMTIDEEIQQVLFLKANDYGHDIVFASARSYRDCFGFIRP